MQKVFAVFAVTLALHYRNVYQIHLLPEGIKYYVLHQPPYLVNFHDKLASF